MMQGVHSLCFELKHLVYINRAIARQSKLQRKQCTFLARFPREPLVLDSGHACHLRYLVFQGDLLAPFRAYSRGATVSKTTQSSPQHLYESASKIKVCTGYSIFNRLYFQLV